MELLVILMEPGKNPITTNIPHDFNYFEKVLGGPIDVNKFFFSGYRLVCSVDNGYSIGDKQLPDGTFFVIKYHTNFESMSVEEAEEIKKILREKKLGKKKSRGLLSIFK